MTMHDAEWDEVQRGKAAALSAGFAAERESRKTHAYQSRAQGAIMGALASKGDADLSALSEVVTPWAESQADADELTRVAVENLVRLQFVTVREGIVSIIRAEGR